VPSSIFLIEFFSPFFREEINICSTCKREAAHFRPDNQLETHAGAGARNALIVDPHHPLMTPVLVNLRRCPRRAAHYKRDGSIETTLARIAFKTCAAFINIPWQRRK